MKRLPIPFIGNKARYVAFREKILYMDDKITDVYDLFGGSFYCGYLVKFLHPNVRVHINSYGTNYMERLKKYGRTKEIAEHIRTFIKTPVGKKMNEEEVKRLKEYILTLGEDEDYETLCCYVCYKQNNPAKTKQEMLNKPSHQFYMNMPLHLDWQYRNVVEYMDVLKKCEFFSCDYFDFNFEQDLFHTLYIIDPPYINTKNPTYKQIDERNLLNILCELFTNKNIIYFASDKNKYFPFIECLNEKGVIKVDITKTIRKNSNVHYTDYMVIKHRNP